MLSERFKILQPIKQDRRFGSVYLGIDRDTNSKVVLKTVNRIENDPAAIERLRSESRFSFEENGLPKVIDYYEDSNTLVLVKSYQSGKALDEYWESVPKRIRNQFLKDFIIKIVDLLGVIHAKSIYHLDLKPGNILIHQTETDFEVSLIDFGLAYDKKVDKERKLLFPLGYAAPELILNKLSIVDHRTDIFALGVCIWKLYTGRLPLSHPNPSIFTNLQITHEIPADKYIPKELFELIKKMTHKFQFPLPPNRYVEDELITHLLDGMNGRLEDLNAVKIEFERLAFRKPFYQRISFR